MKKITIIAAFFISAIAFAQGSPDYGSGLKVNINVDGSKYFRIISWAQIQASYNDNVAATESKTNFNLRRARVLMYSQINKDFLILAHFGLNSLNANNMSPTGVKDNSELFFHDVWAQYSLGKNHAIGGGLHYWNGISRLNNQSTLNIMTLDNNRQSWSTLGLSDQFARHMGVYAKGMFDKFQYRVSINDAITNGLDARDPATVLNTAIYGGRRVVGSRDAGKVYSGYFEYGFKDVESNFLPYKVGSYLGTKKIFNVGAGFFIHPNGSVSNDGSGLKSENVNIFAVDAFYDVPLGAKGGAITAYATYQSNDYGKDYMFNVYGTGSMVYGHVGYVLPLLNTKTKFQPYVSYASNSYDAVSDNRDIFGIGTNAFMNGHNSKLTLEYKNEKFGATKTGTLTLQAMIYL